MDCTIVIVLRKAKCFRFNGTIRIRIVFFRIIIASIRKVSVWSFFSSLLLKGLLFFSNSLMYPERFQLFKRVNVKEISILGGYLFLLWARSNSYRLAWIFKLRLRRHVPLGLPLLRCSALACRFRILRGRRPIFTSTLKISVHIGLWWYRPWSSAL